MSGIDPTFLDALPPELRAEVLENQQAAARRYTFNTRFSAMRQANTRGLIFLLVLARKHTDLGNDQTDTQISVYVLNLTAGFSISFHKIEGSHSLKRGCV